MARDSRNYVISYANKVNKLISQGIDKILEQVAKDVENKLKNYIQNYWYDKYSPKDYERTYSLLDAISSKIDYTNNTVTIYFDEDKFDYISNKNGWGSHRGFYGTKWDEDFGNGLIEFIENGVFDSGKFGSFSNPRIKHGSHALYATEQWINRYVKSEIKKRLSIYLGTKIK